VVRQNHGMKRFQTSAYTCRTNGADIVIYLQFNVLYLFFVFNYCILLG